MSSALDQLRVVLYEPQDPINIGAVVRAMKNMGVTQLRLVRPVPYDKNRIEQVAHGTRDLAERIVHCDTLDEAIGDCVRVVGFSGRRRAARWARTTPREAAVDLLAHAAHGPVAVLFGREDDGLPLDALDRVHAVATIPTTAHASLNVAQAVLVALYELHLAAGDATAAVPRARKHAPPPPQEMLEQYFGDAERALDALDFFKTRNPEHVMRAVRSMTFRADPDDRELGLLRAMAFEVLRTIERETRRAHAAGVAEGRTVVARADA